MPAIPEPPVPVADSQPTALTRYALQDVNTPCQTDGFYVELVSREDSAYQAEVPIKRGTPYAGILGADSRIVAQYAGNPLYFLKQTADIDSMRVMFNSQYDNYVLWIWATQTLSQNSYNSHITYVDESLSAPRFERVSTIKRNVWEANPTLAYQGALTAMVAVQLVTGGTGYGARLSDGSISPTIGTVGNAQAEAVVLNGVIIEWIVTIEGSGIASASALVITGSGTGATATAIIQPVGAILLHQEKRELPDSDPLSHDYVQIINTYETIPGVTLTEEKYDPSTNTFIAVAKTRKLTSAITPSATVVGSTVVITSLEPIDANTSYEVVITQPLPANHDLGTALQSTNYAPYQFPAMLNPALYSLTYGGLGYYPAFTRRVQHQVFTWWEISLTEPDITSAVNGIPILASIYGVLASGSVGTLSELIMNQTDLIYGAATVSWPASTPSLTTYLSDWVGGAPRAVFGTVDPDGNFYRWKVSLTFVQFIIEPQGTIVP